MKNVKEIIDLKKLNLVFPNQLFKESPLLDQEGDFWLIEEPLFFSQYSFHVQKIILHRSSMKYYQEFLIKRGKKVFYVNNNDKISDIRNLIPHLKIKGYGRINYILTEDNYLERRIIKTSDSNNLELTPFENPMFINSSTELKKFFNSSKKKFYHTSFYIEQRKKLKILINEDSTAYGGKWSFDTDNRKKYPKNGYIPKIKSPKSDKFFNEAERYTKSNFPKNPGEILKNPIYPSNHESAKKWLNLFVRERLEKFGPYEDAIVQEESFLNHSVLSPIINIGLITPVEVVKEILVYKNKYPINSIEGFIRQIIGWREFIRGIYFAKGSQERTTNFFGFKRKIPSSFYFGTTNIPPIDITIKKLLKTSYNHHIERLMVLGNFMLLCEFDPDEVYKWFMELYIDSYDWVMVPNVYGMSQFSDGGLMSTKPYISSSNYIIKMSDYSKGDWQKIWDGLYWRFIYKQRNLFKKNIRMSFVLNILDKMSEEKRKNHIKIAETYLNTMK